MSNRVGRGEIENGPPIGGPTTSLPTKHGTAVAKVADCFDVFHSATGYSFEPNYNGNERENVAACAIYGKKRWPVEVTANPPKPAWLTSFGRRAQKLSFQSLARRCEGFVCTLQLIGRPTLPPPTAGQPSKHDRADNHRG